MNVRHNDASYHAHPLFIRPIDYSKLPASPPIDKCFLLDPLIATGGTAVAALHMISDWGVPSMSFIQTTNVPKY